LQSSTEVIEVSNIILNDCARARLPGVDLTPADLAALSQCGIPEDLARTAMLRRVDSATGSALMGRNGSGDYSGLVFPYFWPGDDRVREYRLRRDRPEVEIRADGTTKPRGKYLSPPGRGNMLYLVPGTPPELLGDVSLPIILVEGEKKTLALWALAWHGLGEAAERPRFLPIGLAGVWGWKGSIGKTAAADGSRVSVKGPIPDLSRIAWRKRQAIILFDANVRTNGDVQRARQALTEELQARGARVDWVHWPRQIPAAVNGIDDFVGAVGSDAALELIQTARPAGRSPSADIWTLSELRTASFPEPEPIVDGLLHEGETVAIVGRPKVGKSRLCQQLALCVTRGQAFLDLKVKRPRRVLYLDFENRPAGIRRNLCKLAEPDARGDERLVVYSPETLSENLVSLAQKRGLEHLAELVDRFRPDLLIIDPWRLFLAGDENKAEVVGHALAVLSEVRRRRPALAVLIVHHLRKQPAAGADIVRLREQPSVWVEHASGSMAFVGHTDGCFGLEREKAAGDELIVFGGVARSRPAPLLLLDEDEERLSFSPLTGEDAAKTLFTEGERKLWDALEHHGRFTFSDALEITGARSRTTLACMLRKAMGAGLLTREGRVYTKTQDQLDS